MPRATKRTTPEKEVSTQQGGGRRRGVPGTGVPGTGVPGELRGRSSGDIHDK